MSPTTPRHGVLGPRHEIARSRARVPRCRLKKTARARSDTGTRGRNQRLHSYNRQYVAQYCVF